MFVLALVTVMPVVIGIASMNVRYIYPAITMEIFGFLDFWIFGVVTAVILCTRFLSGPSNGFMQSGGSSI
ncbi:hypothetical protein V8E52_008627 [Russula decolorans]